MKRSWLFILCFVALLGGSSVATEATNPHGGNNTLAEDPDKPQVENSKETLTTAIDAAENQLEQDAAEAKEDPEKAAQKDPEETRKKFQEIARNIQESNLPESTKKELMDRIGKLYKEAHVQWDRLHVQRHIDSGKFGTALVNLEKAKESGLLPAGEYERMAAAIKGAESAASLNLAGASYRFDSWFRGQTGNQLPASFGSSGGGASGGGSSGTSGGSTGGSTGSSGTHSTDSSGASTSSGSTGSTSSGGSTGSAGTGTTSSSGNGGTATSFSSPTPSSSGLSTGSLAGSSAPTPPISPSRGTPSPQSVISGASSPALTTPSRPSQGTGNGAGTHGGAPAGNGLAPGTGQTQGAGSNGSGLITTGAGSTLPLTAGNPNLSQMPTTSLAGGTFRSPNATGGTSAPTLNSAGVTTLPQTNQGTPGALGTPRAGESRSQNPSNVYVAGKGYLGLPSSSLSNSPSTESGSGSGSSSNPGGSGSFTVASNSGTETPTGGSTGTIGTSRGLASTNGSDKKSGGYIQLGSLDTEDLGSSSVQETSSGNSNGPIATANKGSSPKAISLSGEVPTTELAQLAAEALGKNTGTAAPSNRLKTSALSNFVISMTEGNGAPSPRGLAEVPTRALASARGLMPKATPSAAGTRIATAKTIATNGSTWGLMKAAARGLALTLTGNY